MVIYLSLGIYITSELVQSDENLFIRVLKVFVYGVKKIRMPLGSSILFLMLGFDKVMPGVISRSFGRGKGNSLGGVISACVKVLIGSVLSKVGFNILEIILFSKVVSIHSVTGDKVNSFPIAGIAK